VLYDQSSFNAVVLNVRLSLLLCNCAGPGTGVPFHFHGPGFAEVIYGRKVGNNYTLFVSLDK